MRCIDENVILFLGYEKYHRERVRESEKERERERESERGKERERVRERLLKQHDETFSIGQTGEDVLIAVSQASWT